MDIILIIILIAILWPIVRRVFKSKHRYKRTRARKETSQGPVSDSLLEKSISEKVRSTRDIERIQALPNVNVVKILDGDTVEVSNEYHVLRIRLDSIDCPEGDQEWGIAAKKGLIKLIGGKRVKLEEHGADTYGRSIGTLFVYSGEKKEWLNVNERMVTLGHAWVMRLFYGHLPKQRQKKLNDLERWAKSKQVGLWKTENPIPPWEFRKTR